MVSYAFFRSLADRNSQVTVELKNDLCITGSLQKVDQFLNLNLVNVSVNDSDRCPQLLSVKTAFIRGSMVRYVHVSPHEVDAEALQAAAEEKQSRSQASEKRAIS
eukprot:CAMPEP_0206588496 /NCGR_PEP_ID=MMETSP0325_2-20121206/38318_1 /ASSEMBLY_ACC=CAM_ASM_000347 /TAXON_ID=2866 /ORGANISM="Crypthecodinium cohnii, Strain Seligo" /LENGTH=104 /DNA_ID=CAMNT_0054096787 /DNA_START=57 /DNA_END=368 /DNA_ORIENTATION=+